jgi:hypothetical protein
MAISYLLSPTVRVRAGEKRIRRDIEADNILIEAPVAVSGVVQSSCVPAGPVQAGWPIPPRALTSTPILDDHGQGLKVAHRRLR